MTSDITLLNKSCRDARLAFQELDDTWSEGKPLCAWRVLTWLRGATAAVQELERRQAGVTPPKEGE